MLHKHLPFLFKEINGINLGRKVNYTCSPIQRLHKNLDLQMCRIYNKKLEKQSYSPEYYYRSGKEITCQDFLPSHGGYPWSCKPTGGFQ